MLQFAVDEGRLTDYCREQSGGQIAREQSGEGREEERWNRDSWSMVVRVETQEGGLTFTSPLRVKTHQVLMPGSGWVLDPATVGSSSCIGPQESERAAPVSDIAGWDESLQTESLGARDSRPKPYPLPPCT